MKRNFRVTTAGKAKLKALNLKPVEMDTVRMALHGSLGAEYKKRGKITKQVLCDTMEKIIPLCSEIFVQMVPNVDASADVVAKSIEDCDRQLNEDLESIISPEAKGASNDGHEAAVTGSDEAVCKFYKVGKCKFGKKGDQGPDAKEAKCPKSHPPPCRAFDERGPDGCKSDPCPKGKFHRSVCGKLLEGKCPKKSGNCYLYHPPKLSQKIMAGLKKKEEEDRLEMSQMLAEMRSIRQAQLVQFPLQMPPYPFYAMPQPVPAPINNSGLKK